jgi:hypothetical protein
VTIFRIACVAGALLVVVGGQTPAAAAVPNWTYVRQPLPPTHQGFGFARDIHCRSASECVEVGYYESTDVDFNQRAFIATITANHASAVTAPLPPGALRAHNDPPVLEKTDCPTSGACLAVGTYPTTRGSLPLLETQTSSGWQPSTFRIDGLSDLQHVACGASCLALGQSFQPPGYVLLAQSGGGWTQPTITVPARYELNGLEDVACAPTGSCYAFGYLADARNALRGAILVPRAGGYQARFLPAPPGGWSSGDRVTKMACWADGQCAVVVTYDDGAHVVVETLSGDDLTAVPISLPSQVLTAGPPVLIGDMSCSGSGTCAVVGVYGRDDPDNGLPFFGGLLITRQSGEWSAQVAPTPPGEADARPELDRVSCSSNGACAAAGTAYPWVDGPYGALVETYSAGAWTARDIGVPDAGQPVTDEYATLAGVGCAEATCVATGGYGATDSQGHEVGGPVLARTRHLTSWSR